MSACDDFPLPDWATDFFPVIEQLSQDIKRQSYNPFLQLSAPKSTEASDIRSWIKRITIETNTTPTEIANKADLAPSTINKFMTDVDNIRNLNARTLNKIKIAAVELLALRARSDEYYIEKEFGIDKVGDLPLIHSNPYYLREIRVIGDLYDHAIRVASELQLPDERMYNIILPTTRRFINSTLCALQLNVSNVEDYYRYQDIIVCSPVWKFEGEIVPGDRLVVAEKDKYPGQCRLGIRDFLGDPKGHSWFVSPYDIRDDVQPIYAGKNGRKAYPESIEVLFVVAGSYHNR